MRSAILVAKQLAGKVLREVFSSIFYYLIFGDNTQHVKIFCFEIFLEKLFSLSRFKYYTEWKNRGV